MTPDSTEPTSALLILSTHSLIWAVVSFLIVVLIVIASSVELAMDTLSQDEYLARLAAVSLMGTAYFSFLSPHRDRRLCKGTAVLFLVASFVTFASASEFYLPSQAPALVAAGPILTAVFLLALWAINATEVGDTKLLMDFITDVFSR